MKSLVLGLCVAILFAFHRPELAMAMSCDNRGANQNLHYGSNVLGDKVTICAEYWWPKPAHPVVPKPIPKHVQPVKVDPNWFVVSPQKPRAVSLEEQHLNVGGLAVVTTTAATHQVKKLIIGRLAMVRFTPTRVLWKFGDRTSAVGNDQWHTYLQPGIYMALAEVSYSVQFRFLGSTKWIREPRGITLRTNNLRFVVSESFTKATTPRPYLVYFDCMKVQRAGC